MEQQQQQKIYKFDGTVVDYWGMVILSFILLVITLGLAAPWVIVMRQKWIAHHTILSGQRLKFIGSGWNLLGKWIIWYLLTIITAGIYSFWVAVKLQKWKIENTVPENL